MSRLTPDTLLQRAIWPAVQDRITLVDACNGEGPVAAEARASGLAIHALQNKRFTALTPAEYVAAREAFLFAEQWESDLADSQAGTDEGRACEERAAEYRELRMRLWGETKLEAFARTARAVRIEV
jgi:hypothetical protein